MKRRETTTLINGALRVIGQTGLSGVSANSNSLYNALYAIDAIPKSISKPLAIKLANEMRRQKLIEVTKKNDTIRIQLSVKGIHRLQHAQITSLEIPRQEPWDKKWRILMFDIPARKADSRYLLTSSLRRLGFTLVQGSVWAHPFPCHDVIYKLSQFANIQDCISFFEVSALDSITKRKLLRAYPDLATTKPQQQ